MKDMTKGFPAKVILAFAIPLMLGNILQQFYNIVDSKIVSQYVSVQAFEAVGATAIVAHTLIAFINGLTQGFAIPIATAFGAGDFHSLRKNIVASVRLLVIFTVSLTAACMIFIRPILVLLKTPDTIMPDALSYLRIILMGTAFVALYNMCASILRAVGDSKTPLYCLLISVVINIFLDLLFVIPLHMGIRGAALATILAQAMSGAACFAFILLKFKDLIPRREDKLLTGDIYSELFSAGIAMALMTCIVNIGTIILQSGINGLGEDIIAAHTSGRKLLEIMMVFIYTIGIAMTTYVSQNLGAGQKERIRSGIRQSFVIVTVISTVLLLFALAFAEPIVRWIVSSDDAYIVSQGVRYVKFDTCFFYALGPLFILRCSLQGLGRKVVPLISSAAELAIKIIAVLVLIPAYGYFGVVLTEPISWCVMTAILILPFLFKNPIR